MLLLLFACSEPPASEPPPAEPAHRVLVIGVDGLRPDALVAAPELRALLDEGALVLDAHTQRTGPTTVSGPGWASVLTGVEVEDHHVTSNDDLGALSPDWPPFPQRAQEAGRSVAVAVHWPGILPLLGETVPDALDLGTDAEVGAIVASRVADPSFDLIFAHFDDADHAGHATGFSADNPDYLAAVAGIDAAVKSALDELTSRGDEAWRVVLCTDHGGLGTDHSVRSADTETIPLGVYGGEVRVPGAPSHLDVAPTVLAWLGVAHTGLDGVSWGP